MSEYTAIVVGAGPNGLAAAVHLAENGCRVLVIEAADTIGGGTSSRELTRPGFVHDVCSAIHPLGYASPYLEQLDLREHGLHWEFPTVPLAHPLDRGGSAILFGSIEDTAAGLGGDRSAYRKLMRPLVDSWPKIRNQVLGPVVRVPRHPVKMARFGLKAVQPATKLAGRFDDPRARALFAGLAAHSVAPLEHSLTSGVALTLGIAAHRGGWPAARGGSQRIADALGSLLTSLGGEIVTGQRVTSLDDVPDAEIYLLDTSPEAAIAIGASRIDGRATKSLRSWRHGPGVFKVDWALDGPIPWADPEVAGAGTVHLGGTFEEIAAAEATTYGGGHPERPFVLLAQQSMFDPTRAPAGRHTGWAYCHVPAGSKVDMTEAIERQVERFAPDFRDRIMARHTMGPADFERGNANLVGGDVTGGEITFRQVLARPTARRDPYRLGPDVFLCSASTPPGAGVHGMAGYHAARSALKRLGRGS